MKILFLSHSFFPQPGGIESNSELLAAAFTEAGHTVHLLTWTPDNTGQLFPYMVTRNPGKRKLIREHYWADVVFENNPCFRLGWPALLFGRPTIVAINTWIARASGRVSFRDKIKINWWLKRCRQVIAVSDAVRQACWPAATVILNPYKADDFSIMPEITRDADFAFLGRLVSDKGAEQAIEAIQQLRTLLQKERSSCSPTLTIIGDGPERGALEDMVASRALSGAVHFTGVLKGKPLRECLNRHRYLLVPSSWEEPFGNVVLEGMACGCLPIASNGGGLPEAVGNAGITFHRNDVKSLLGSIRRIMQDPKLDRQLRDAAPAHLEAHHPRMVARKYLQVIEKACHP